ncbi:hypothetical protein [Dongia deserti]|uniref:hypothetical protein n=1 Tax=Dongia deserti TaxID=2268030 RepID=UPI0013C4B310|nr:hypothetical protein [Dongia deserti]
MPILRSAGMESISRLHTATMETRLWHGAKKHLLRILVYLVVGPLVGGATFDFWTIVSTRPLLDSTLTAIVLLPVVMLCGLPVGWKAALFTGLAMSLLTPLFRYRPASLLSSAVVGGGAGGSLLLYSDLLPSFDWHGAGFGAAGAIAATLVVHIWPAVAPRSV